MSLHAIKQVEIIRGPGAALYGSNAFLGVVNLITDKEKQNIQIGKGSQGRSHVSTFYGDELATDLKVHLGAEFYSDNGTEYLIDDTLKTRDPRVYQKMDVGLNYKNIDVRLMYSKEETDQFFNFAKVNNEINRNHTQNMFYVIPFLLNFHLV